MTKTTYRFSSGSTDYYQDAAFRQLQLVTPKSSTIIVTDDNVYHAHKKKFQGWETIVLKAGEEYKVQETADTLISALIDLKASRSTTLVGVGGGVITDLTGYVAAVFMRGIRFGFVPTTVLGMVDAAIGGKNGVDLDIYKNIVGTIRQPAFLLYDYSFLGSLPIAQWQSGFAEIIKHACIKDSRMFSELEDTSPNVYRNEKKRLSSLIRKNVLIKTRIVQKDESEKSQRKLLNFGHTLGHALENQYELSHGEAIAIGMTFASGVSQNITGFRDADRVISLLEKYKLPTHVSFNPEKVINAMVHDKKRVGREIHFVLLKKIGDGILVPVSLKKLEKMILNF